MTNGEVALETGTGVRADVAEIGDLRAHTARGTILNGAYQIFLSGTALSQRLIAAAFLTAAEFGLWAVVLTVLINLSWLKDLGVTDKYLQQTEPDQEKAFQKAFTIDLYSALALFVLIAALLPAWAYAYGHEEIIVAGLLTAISIPLNALQAPSWIPYRLLQYRRHRLLTGVPVITGFVVTISLAVMGAGYWCFVAGILTGSAVGGAVCTATSPYRLRLRIDASTVRDYVSFSWPLVASGAAALVLVQASLLIVNATAGLAGVGAVGIVIGIVTFAQRVDTVLGQTMYPAICAAVRRRDLLREIFLKSNRLALIWAIPFTVGLALFAGDIVTFVLGEKWRSVEDLLVVIGLSVGLGQVAFNWAMFFRATNYTRPIFAVTLVNVVVFLLVLALASSEFGLMGYGIAFAASTAVQVLLRSYYIHRLIGGFAVLGHTVRAMLPVVPPAALVLIMRIGDQADRGLTQALTELLVFCLVAVASTALLERRLLAEVVDYLRRGAEPKGVIAPS